MTPTFKTAVQEVAVNDAEKLLVSGADHELILSFLRERGFYKMDSIKALVRAGGMPLREAKVIVQSSKTWHDVYLRDEHFQEKLWQVVGELEKHHKVCAIARTKLTGRFKPHAVQAVIPNYFNQRNEMIEPRKSILNRIHIKRDDFSSRQRPEGLFPSPEIAVSTTVHWGVFHHAPTGSPS